MFKWFVKKLSKAVRDFDREQQCVPSTAKELDSEINELAPNLRMNIINAVGGKVVRFIGEYDHQKDRRNDTLYIITDEEDFHDSLSKIITVESMKT